MSLQLSIFEFIAALHGKPGELDAWLEVNNEAEVRSAILAYGRAQRERCAVVCESTRAKDAFHWELGTGCAAAIRSLPDMEPQI